MMVHLQGYPDVREYDRSWIEGGMRWNCPSKTNDD